MERKPECVGQITQLYHDEAQFRFALDGHRWRTVVLVLLRELDRLLESGDIPANVYNVLERLNDDIYKQLETLNLKME